MNIWLKENLAVLDNITGSKEENAIALWILEEKKKEKSKFKKYLEYLPNNIEHLPNCYTEKEI